MTGPESFVYRLRQHINRSISELRQAEDIARMEQPGWPTADRIRSIYEQISEDVLNGRTNIPPLLERLSETQRALNIVIDASELPDARIVDLLKDCRI